MNMGGPFGVMGGFIQPQGHVMVIVNTVDFKLSPQAALDAPRFRWTGGRRVDVEDSFPRNIAEELSRMGHQISYAPPDDFDFGRGQIIWRGKEGVLAAGSEPRADGEPQQPSLPSRKRRCLRGGGAMTIIESAVSARVALPTGAARGQLGWATWQAVPPPHSLRRFRFPCPAPCKIWETPAENSDRESMDI